MGQILLWWRFYFIVRNRSKQAAFGLCEQTGLFSTLHDDNGIVEKCKINEVTQVHNEFRNQYNRE